MRSAASHQSPSSTKHVRVLSVQLQKRWVLEGITLRAGGTLCGGRGAGALEAGLLFSDVLAEDDANDCEGLNEYDAEGPDTAATPAVLEVD